MAIADLQESPQLIQLAGPYLTFDRPELLARLVSKGILERVADVETRLSDEETAALQKHFQMALDLLRTIDADAAGVFDSVINEVAVFQVSRPEAGTITSEIGLIYCSARPHWSETDWLRILFHEAAHTVLNIFDMTLSLMPEPALLDAHENSCYSAVRHEPRRFHSAFHAVFVATWMIWLESRLCLEDSDEIIAAARQHGRRAIQEIRAVVQRTRTAGRCILSARGRTLLDDMADFLDPRPHPVFLPEIPLYFLV